MTTAQQMNAARKAVRQAIKDGCDRTGAHRYAVESLLANGMEPCIVNEMGMKAMLDVVCGI